MKNWIEYGIEEKRKWTYHYHNLKSHDKNIMMPPFAMILLLHSLMPDDFMGFFFLFRV